MKTTLKKTLALILAVAMVFCFTACKESTDTSSNGSSLVADNSIIESTDTVTSEELSDSSETSQVGGTSSQGDSSTNNSSTTSTQTATSSKVTTSAATSSSGGQTSSGNYEKPYEGNAAILCKGQTSKYDSQAEALRLKIVNAKDSGLKGTATYYVSYKGSDYNTGTSKDSPWKTINMVNQRRGSMPSGSVILFERGGVYRGKLYVNSNTSVGAYGSGPKPCIYGSSQNYALEYLWTKTSTPNVWKLTTNEGDVGNVVFDHGKVATGRKPNISALSQDYDMFSAKGVVYLYLSKGNPAKLHKDIELNGTSGQAHIITGPVGAKNIHIENLCVKYGGIHGITFVNSENITIKNCEIGYIGGAMMNNSAWYGNGIEFWNSCKNVLVDSNWVYQCYDAGITNQGTKVVEENVTFSNNLVEYCAYNIEYFIDENEGEFKNITYSDNILRFAGGGWADPKARQSGADGGVALICGWGARTYKTTNFVIKNNILDTSYRYLVYIGDVNSARNAKLEGNTYYQVASQYASICMEGTKTSIYAQNATQFKEVIAKIDPKAKAAEFVSK